ncbi:unnamed protein product, partial [Heterobilharzia americana]
MTVDYLSCGTCFVTFRLSDISMFIEHKKASCPSKSTLNSNELTSKHASRLSQPPTCQVSLTDATNNNTDESSNNNDNNCNAHESEDVVTGILKCVQCFRKFTTPWPLLLHVQIEHQLIFINSYETSFSNREDDDEEEEQMKLSPFNSEELNYDAVGDHFDNNKLYSSKELLVKEVNNFDSDAAKKIITTTTSSNCITTSAADTSLNNTNSVSTQTYLIGIKQRVIPHRKRKYFNCCIGEPAVTCRKISNVSCIGFKANDHAPSSCCTNLPSGICPYSNPINGNPIDSGVFVSDYCCTRSVVCKPTNCTNALNTTEAVGQDTSGCTATAVVSCCMRKVVCCSSAPVSLPIYFDQSTKGGNRSVLMQETPVNTCTTAATSNITTINKTTKCCPCSPKKIISSQSSEVQTDFDPEFSYSDYADLAMLLTATPTSTTTTTIPISPLRLSPLPQLLSSEVHQLNEHYQNSKTDLKVDILKPFTEMNDTSNEDSRCLESQVNATSVDSNRNNNEHNSIIFNNLTSSLDLDLPLESLIASSGVNVTANTTTTTTTATNSNILISTTTNDNIIPTDNFSVQWPTVIQTNIVPYSNNTNDNHNNSA